MSVIVSSFMPFPSIAWWMSAAKSETIILDRAEHFEKMSYRNKYYITGANGPITLSIPLTDGREQRKPMKDVQICNKDRWQIQHWRTLVSVYKRSPYFEHYEPSLERLFHTQYDLLIDFNLATIEWLKAQLKLKCNIEFADTYLKEHEGTIDLRNLKRSKDVANNTPKYYQLFEERNGFLPNLSLLDLLFSEGPATVGILAPSAP
jgi:hypothetical protein